MRYAKILCASVGTLLVSGCATAGEWPPVEPTVQVLERLKQAQVSDHLLEADLASTLQKALGAKALEESASGGYRRATISQIPGFEHVGPMGPADIIVERWDAEEGPVVQIVFRPKSYLPAKRVQAVFADYVFYDTGHRVYVDHLWTEGVRQSYASPADFSVGFYCSSPGFERNVRVGISDFGAPLEYRFLSRRAANFDGSIPKIVGQITVAPEAGWIVAANSAPAVFPDRALRLEWQGAIQLDCRAAPSGRLEDCKVRREQPGRAELTASALSWSQTAMLERQGGQAERVVIELTFGLTHLKETCPALSTP